MKIKKLNSQELKKLQNKVIEQYDTYFEVGYHIYDRDGYYGIVEDFWYEEEVLWIQYKSIRYYKGESKKTTFKELNSYYKMHFSKHSPDEYTEKLKTEMFLTHDDDKEISNETGIMIQSKDVLEERKKELIIKTNDINAKKSMIESIYNSKRWELMNMVENFQKEIKKIKKLLFTLEVYLGIEEGVYQIQEGKYSDNEQLTIRQRMLFMDEEVGNPLDGGLEFTNINQFDDWLLKKHEYFHCKNYELLAPEEKCIVGLRVRRNKKERGNINPFVKINLEAEDMYTYILIRNGENVYRLWSQLELDTKLFPSKTEMVELQEKYEKQNSRYDKDVIEEKVDQYRHQFILFQGLVDRLDSLMLMYKQINFLSPTIHQNKYVNFIYDGDDNLLDDEKGYWKWHKKNNKGIKEGSRVFLIGHYSGNNQSSRESQFVARRLYKKYPYYSAMDNIWNVTPAPKKGVYIVETDKKTNRRDKDEVEILKIMYNPKDEVTFVSWEYDPHTRKNRLSFEIQKEDYFVINYDTIEETDLLYLEYMMYQRTNRKDYLHVIPALQTLIEYKKKELDQEEQFAKLCLSNGKDIDALSIKKAIRWWKVKNKWKRSLYDDETKALRMITNKAKKYTNENTN